MLARRRPGSNAMPDRPGKPLGGGVPTVPASRDMFPGRPAWFLNPGGCREVDRKACEQFPDPAQRRCRNRNIRAVQLPPDLVKIDGGRYAACSKEIGIRCKDDRAAVARVIAGKGAGRIAKGQHRVRTGEGCYITAPVAGDERAAAAICDRGRLARAETGERLGQTVTVKERAKDAPNIRYFKAAARRVDERSEAAAREDWFQARAIGKAAHQRFPFRAIAGNDQEVARTHSSTRIGV